MKWLKRRIKKALTGLIWFIIKLPFKLIYLIFKAFLWLLSGKKHTPDGYILKKSKSGRMKLEHREIAEEVLGRRLAPWEVVHHINGQRNDNSPSNLCVMHHRNHVRYHQWYDWVRAQGSFPRKITQLKKLRETFNGIILTDSEIKRKRTG